MIIYEVRLHNLNKIIISEYNAQIIPSIDGIIRYRLFEPPDGAWIKDVEESELSNSDSLTQLYVCDSANIPEARQCLIDNNIAALKDKINHLETLRFIHYNNNE